MNYLRDGQAIYSRSFAMIRAEADLKRFATDEVDVVVRMIHACGLVALASDECCERIAKLEADFAALKAEFEEFRRKFE